MSIHYQLDFDDILALQQDVIKHSHPHQIKQAYFKWISAIIIFLVILFSFGPSFVSMTVSAVITVILVLVFPILYEKLAFARAKSKIQNQDFTHILAPCETTLTDEGITRDINGETTYFAWDTFIRSSEDDYRYFLYQTELQGLILPKQPKDLTSNETKDYQSMIHTRTTIL